MSGTEVRVKVAMLNPGDRLLPVFADCRAVVLAGGTMEPADELCDPVGLARFSSVMAGGVRRFSCGHVVDASRQLLLATVAKGPSGRPLNFSFANRKRDEIVADLGRTLLSVVTLVPGGVVVFLPSYEYADFVCRSLATNGILERIQVRFFYACTFIWV